jgi:hypothetical protein
MGSNLEDSRSAATRIAVPVLWLLIGLALAMVAWRSYEAIYWVDPGLRAEFLLIYAGYPLALAAVESLALALLYKGRTAGRILAAAVFAYAAFHAASQCWSDGEVAYVNDVDRAAGRITAILATAALVLLAVSLLREHLRENRLVKANRSS